jgi:hypothetical protein
MASIITVGSSASTTTAGSTFGDLIEKVYRRTMGSIRERAVQVLGNYDNGTSLVTSLSSSNTTVYLSGSQVVSIMPGVILAVDMEMMYVYGYTALTSTTGYANVERGYNGSTAASHAISSTQPLLSYINPRYSRFDIGVAINDDLRSLSSPSNGLFRVGVAELTYNPVFAGYDLGALPANFIDILEIRYRIAPPYRTFPAIKRWKVIRWQQNSTDPSFPSGLGLVLYEAGWPGLPIYVTYSAPFIKLVGTSDSMLNTPGTNDEAPPFNGYSSSVVANFTGPTTVGSSSITLSGVTGLYIGMAVAEADGAYTYIPQNTFITGINTGTNTITLNNTAVATSSGSISINFAPPVTVPNMTPTMLDLPPLGAEIDLTQPREISRNFIESQPDPRKALEIVAGAVAGSVNALVARRAQRISEEADRLTRQYTKVRAW